MTRLPKILKRLWETAMLSIRQQRCRAPLPMPEPYFLNRHSHTILGCLYQLLVTFCLGALSTILGATYDYTHRLIHFDRREEDAAVLAQATGAGDSVSARVGCIEGRRSD